MPRKKTKKKSAPRKTAIVSKPVDVQKLEKDMLNAPSTLASELSKQIAVLKKKVNQLKADHAKAKQGAKASTNHIATARKNAATRAGKKLLVNAKKTLADALKNQAFLSKQLKAAEKELVVCVEKLDKATELEKYFNQFDKIWSKKLREKTQKAKQAKKAKKAAAKSSTHDSSLDVFEAPVSDGFEAQVLENALAEEMVEPSSQ